MRVKRKGYLTTIISKNDSVNCHAEVSLKLSHNDLAPCAVAAYEG